MRIGFTTIFLITAGFWAATSYTATASAEPAKRPCAMPTVEEPTTGRSDWFVFTDLLRMKNAFDALYQSGKRIQRRAHWDENQNAYVFPNREEPVRIDNGFLHSLSAQLGEALKSSYADFPFYPDMGHVHLLATDTDSAQLEQITDRRQRTEKTLSLPGLKTLFHTAELMKLREGETMQGPVVADPWLQWRYYSRNFIGNMKDERLQVVFAKGAKYNTVRSLPGHREHSTLYFSASKDGCFTIPTAQGPLYFDLSAE